MKLALAVSLAVITTAAARADFILSPGEAKRQMTTRASIVRGALARKDLKTLARMVHPVKGLRFPGDNGESGPTFKQSQVPGLFTDAKKYDWGKDGESNTPARQTFKERYKRIYGRDYQHPAETNYNTLKRRPLNYVTDLDKQFPGAVCVEFYVSGTEKYGGVDWSSLWLVFERYGDGWRLTAIRNDYQGV
ncbi:MAG: hypothetical protein QM758_22355 [Armatimonas sp.]